MAPLRTARRQRATGTPVSSRASCDEEQPDDEDTAEGEEGVRTQDSEDGVEAEDGFALEEVLRLGGTKQDFIMLAGLGDPEEMIDGGKKGAIDDLKPGELEAFVKGLGLGRFPESCRLQIDESLEEENKDGDGDSTKKKAKELHTIPGSKETSTPVRKEGVLASKREKGGKKKAEDPPSSLDKLTPGTKNDDVIPAIKGQGSSQRTETEEKSGIKAKKITKKQPLQLNEVSSTSGALKKASSPENFQFHPRPILLIKPGGKWYDMEYTKEATSQPQDAVQVSKYKVLAQKLYEHESDLYKSKKDLQKGAGYAWMKTVVSSGTLADRMAAMTLLIQDAAVHTLQFIESLVNLIKKKASRRQCLMALDTFKELLLSDLLPDHRKLVPFSQHPFDKLEKISSGNKDARDRRLILWYFEHQLKHQVAEFVQVLEALSHDTLLATKTRALTVAHELLCTKPEEEKALLVQLVNKLGDPQYRVATKATYLLEILVQKHPNMKGVVCYEVERLLYRPNISTKAQYYGICFLNQTILSHDESDLANNLITVYFCFFRSCIKKKDVESKMLRALLSGVNRAFPYANIGSEKVTEQLNTLFKIVHSVNFNTSVQVFMLLFQVMDSQQTVSHRYYAALYKKLLDPGLVHCSKQSMFLNLVYKSMKADVELRRVKAFMKRLLQVTCGSMAPFICGALYLVSEILRLKPALRALLQEQGESDDEEHFHDCEDDDDNLTDQEKKTKEIHETKEGVGNAEVSNPAHSWIHLQTLKGGISSSIYDPLNRNPLFCGADCTSLWELRKLSEHFHPSVAHFAKTVLQGDRIQYTGDPLQDFTLMRFLDRFVYRNPKLQKDNVDRPGAAMRPKKKIYMNNVHTHAVNSKEFLEREESQIPVEEVFFHRFYRKVAKEKKRPRFEEESVEDVDDDEFERLLDSFEGDALGIPESDDLDFASNVKKSTKGSKKSHGGDASSSSDSEFEDDEDGDLDDEVISLGSMDDEDFGEDIAEEGGAFVDITDDEDEQVVDDTPPQTSKVGSKTGKRKRSESAPPGISKHRKKGFKVDSKLSAAAEEFGFLLDEHSGAKFDNIGMNAMANKENASLKQLKWEAERDNWLHKKDRRTKRKFNPRKPARKHPMKRK
ncbi:CCAAT/enhancer-binding protein zeta [Ambystoma mexicanum]|uniref:CCAAT/enhancer-binding protein zeta n=1 Tax=Ambystoma mexicanum TaxID=8296 RepID=UPI0037E9C1CA